MAAGSDKAILFRLRSPRTHSHWDRHRALSITNATVSALGSLCFNWNPLAQFAQRERSPARPGTVCPSGDCRGFGPQNFGRSAKPDFFNKIGTSRTSPDVRLESAKWSKDGVIGRQLVDS